MILTPEKREKINKAQYLSLFNSLCANAPVEGRLKERLYVEARTVATKRGKTLRIEAKYCTNRGLSAWPLTLSLCRKIGIVSSQSSWPNFHHGN